ncbi:MAG: ROK family protein [Anaerocolumna aminovalerica]|uniref:ROK family protein n=1 Tax=Anaerocolumna aminovalerica TaxID=1527 RepID=UPI002912AC0A|nr:ROK family protein [Anaerocolumna aminovalerica]MDU6264220.1 ROK family protein [Anaerocolumna aminovalerica]
MNERLPLEFFCTYIRQCRKYFLRYGFGLVMNILALDVGGTAIKSALINNGEILKGDECLSEARLGGPRLVENIMKTIDSYSDYDVISISTTGQVDSEKGCIIYANENVPDYTGTKLSMIIKKKYNKPVFLENDVNAAAIGEGFYGAGKGEKNFLCLTYGTGIGGAIVFNGKIYKGSNGVAGEMGHMVTHINGLSCNCGHKGCYEQYASTTALLRNAMAYDNTLNNGYLIFSELEQGNKEIKDIVDNWIDEIIYGLVNLIHIFNPSCIILGGGIMKQKYIINSINEKILNKIMDSFQGIKIVPAQLGNNAGVYGMAAIAEQRLKK